MSRSAVPRWRRAAAVSVGAALAVAGTAALLGAPAGVGSSHREAPLIAGDPAADNTDTYAFVSPDDPDTVTLIANWLPFQEPGGGPNFYPWATGDQARYNIKIDNNGDAVPDITYQWRFETQDTRGDVDYGGADGTFLYNNGPVNSLDDATLLFSQTYDLVRIDADGEEEVIVDGAPVAPSHVGDASMPNYASLRDQAIVETTEGGQSFAGQADDPFFLDLRVFDLLYGGDLSQVGVDTLEGFNVNSVALQVPISELVDGDDPVIGVWSTTDRPSMRVQDADGSQSFDGDWVQVSRLGNPLVNEVVIPAQLKDAFNALAPEADASVDAAVAKVLDPELSILLEAIYGLPAKETPRTDLQAIFLTGLAGLNQPAEVTPSEQLRLNTSIAPTADPDRLGVLAGDNAGFPNGRRLTDDVVDIALQAVAGAVSVDEAGAPTGVEIVEPLAAGDAVDANDQAFGMAFPYLALPNSGSTVSHGSAGAEPGVGSPMPSGGMDTGQATSAQATALPEVPLGLAVALLGAAALVGTVGLVAVQRGQRRSTVRTVP
jgi:hypothetical protein